MCGTVQVEAESVEAAMEKFKKESDHIALPDKDSYVDGSFNLTEDNEEFVKLFNETKKV